MLALALLTAILVFAVSSAFAQAKAEPRVPPSLPPPPSKEQIEQMIRQRMEEARQNRQPGGTPLPGAPVSLPPGFGAAAQTTTPKDWKLVGFSTVGSVKLAVVSCPERWGRPTYLELRAGQSFGGCEMRSIDIPNGTVLLHQPKPDPNAPQPGLMDVVLHLEGRPAADVPASQESGWFELRDVPAKMVLEFYGKFSHRNMLASESILAKRLTMTGHNLTPETAVKCIADALKKKHIQLQPDGEKFMVALPEGARLPKVKAPAIQGRKVQVPVIPAPPPSPANHGGATTLLPGFINLKGMDIFQLLDFYGELIGQRVAIPPGLPSAQVTFASQTAITREEANYALTMMMALNGVGIRPATNGGLEACDYAELADNRKP